MVMSDHGFHSFRREVNLNTWLVQNGYMIVRGPERRRRTCRTCSAAASSSRASTGRRPGPTPWASARSTSTCGAARRKGIVSAGEEYRQLQDEIRAKLVPLTDPDTGERVFADIYKRDDIYKGEYLQIAPDLQVGFHDGYRVGWQDTLGTIRRGVVENNNKKWTGDHCATATEICAASSSATGRSRPRAAHHGPRPHDPEAARDPGPRGLRRQAALVKAALLVLALAGAPQEPRRRPSRRRPRARAVSDAERLKKVQERREALERELARMRGEEKSLLGEVERLELELRLRSEELTEIQITLQRTRAQLDATVARVSQLEKSLAEARPVLARHARALYKLGDLCYVRLLLSVDRPVGHLSRLPAGDHARAPRQRARRAASARTCRPHRPSRPRSRSARSESLALRTSSAAARRNLDAQRERKTELLTSLVERKEMNAAYVDELEQAEARLQALLVGPRRRRRRGAARRLPRRPAVAGRGRGAGALRPPQAPALRHLHPAQRDRDRGAPRRAGARGARGPGGLRRPLPRLRAHGRGGPRRQAPFALRAARRGPVSHRASRLRPGTILGRPRGGAGGARASTSRCASRAGPKTPRAGWSKP